MDALPASYALYYGDRLAGRFASERSAWIEAERLERLAEMNHRTPAESRVVKLT